MYCLTLFVVSIEFGSWIAISLKQRMTWVLPPAESSWVKRGRCLDTLWPVSQGKDLKWCEMPHYVMRHLLAQAAKAPGNLWQWPCKAAVRSTWQWLCSQQGAESYLDTTGPLRQNDVGRDGMDSAQDCCPWASNYPKDLVHLWAVYTVILKNSFSSETETL